jgi:hypothetical protein
MLARFFTCPLLLALLMESNLGHGRTMPVDTKHSSYPQFIYLMKPFHRVVSFAVCRIAFCEASEILFRKREKS